MSMDAALFTFAYDIVDEGAAEVVSNVERHPEKATVPRSLNLEPIQETSLSESDRRDAPGIRDSDRL